MSPVSIGNASCNPHVVQLVEIQADWIIVYDKKHFKVSKVLKVKCPLHSLSAFRNLCNGAGTMSMRLQGMRDSEKREDDESASTTMNIKRVEGSDKGAPWSTCWFILSQTGQSLLVFWPIVAYCGITMTTCFVHQAFPHHVTVRGLWISCTAWWPQGVI